MSSCWDDCGYHWYSIGDKTTCTRDIYDGTVDYTKMVLEVTNIQIDPDLGCEPCEHIADCYIKIYEFNTGGSEEIMVYESVHTILHMVELNIYKYNQWKVYLGEGIDIPPKNVNIKISHKDLCPGCTHNYLCDCEVTVDVDSAFNWTSTSALVINDPSKIYEKMQVELLDIASNWESISVNVKIWNMYAGGGTVLYDSNHIIYKDNWIDISQGNLEFNWRVCCNDISPQDADLQLCYSFEDSGEGNGSGGIGGFVIGQYFDTRGFGWTGGCAIECHTENPRRHAGENNVPTEVELNLYEWQGDYHSTIDSPTIASSIGIAPSEAITDDYVYIPFVWDYDAPPGEYLWELKSLRGPHNGSFRLHYDDVDYKFPAWVNGRERKDIISTIYGIESEPSWGKVLNIDDMFAGQSFKGLYGHEKIKINTPDGYKDAMTTEEGNNLVIKHPGSPEELTNPSFADGTTNGWTIGVRGDCTITPSSDWSSNDNYSAKLYRPAWSAGDSCYLYQMLAIQNVAPGWTITWDMKVEGGGTYDLKVHLFGKLVYDSPLFNGTFYNLSGTTTTPVSGPNGYIGFHTHYYCCEIEYSKTIYIDNIRIIPPDMGTLTQGRIVGGASNVKIV